MAKKKSDGTDDTSVNPAMLASDDIVHDIPLDDASATSRLRAFEDKHLGIEAVRLDGSVERGVGSQYSRLSPARKREYEALEKIVATEKALAEAHSALVAADAAHEEAMNQLAAAEAEPDADPAE